MENICEESATGLEDGGVQDIHGPVWTRTPYYYPTDPTEELRTLQDYKKELETELAELTKRIEELKSLIEKK